MVPDRHPCNYADHRARRTPFFGQQRRAAPGAATTPPTSRWAASVSPERALPANSPTDASRRD
jgi:hypothetical protein